MSRAAWPSLGFGALESQWRTRSSVVGMFIHRGTITNHDRIEGQQETIAMSRKGDPNVRGQHTGAQGQPVMSYYGVYTAWVPTNGMSLAQTIP